MSAEGKAQAETSHYYLWVTSGYIVAGMTCFYKGYEYKRKLQDISAAPTFRHLTDQHYTLTAHILTLTYLGQNPNSAALHYTAHQHIFQ